MSAIVVRASLTNRHKTLILIVLRSQREIFQKTHQNELTGGGAANSFAGRHE